MHTHPNRLVPYLAGLVQEAGATHVAQRSGAPLGDGQLASSQRDLLQLHPHRFGLRRQLQTLQTCHRIRVLRVLEGSHEANQSLSDTTTTTTQSTPTQR